MSYRHLPFAVVLLVGAAVLHADDPAPPTVAPYVLKKRSAFANPGDVPRAPFWPIGWVKRQASAPAQVVIPEVKVALDEKFFKVTSILINTGTTPSLAVINGRAYSEGEFLRVPHAPGTAALRVRVQRITDGSVILQHADQTFISPLLRTELTSKRPEETLLDPDR